MLNINFYQINFLIYFLILIFYYWYFFFKLNFYTLKKRIINSDKISKFNLLKKNNFYFLFKFNLVLTLNQILLFLFYKNYSISILWGHLLLNNFSFNLIFFFLIFNLLIFIYIYFLSFNSVNYNFDYFFSIVNLSVFLPLIFLSDNIFSFFFILEFVSYLIFYKFVCSKIWYKNKINFYKNNSNFYNFNKIIPKNFLNILFFQFWATFFSSIFFLFVFLNLLFLLGSTQWNYLNLMVLYELKINYFNNNFNLILFFFIFLIGFFLKVGLTPFHLFKIEIYKGIPFLSIFFYTTYYFLIFFLYFLILLASNLFSFYILVWFILVFFLIFGSLYIISLLFDLSFIKAFFAYSTVINSINFFLISLAIASTLL
uniref:ymf65 n=1 Tax=Cryptocaryon irritans TaxID=153251 RepID=UPI0022FD829E|nr:ymf65 [Cryptocaryon irritans]WBP62343.1 ymf65 [Cryptocaryon irritans]